MRDLVNYLSPPTLLSFLALSHITSSQLAPTVPMVPTCTVVPGHPEEQAASTSRLAC